MYDLILVRRRRRRKIAALVSLICSIGVSSLVIVSFLGQNTGTFTISITSSPVRMSLSKYSSFENPTTYLRIEKLDQFEECTYSDIINQNLDDENKDFDCGAEEVEYKGQITRVFPYLKYTFFLRNEGKKTARYNLNVNLIECTASTDGTSRTLDETLRVLVYENDLDDTTYANPVHTEEVFAKEANRTNKTENGDPTKRAFISSYDSTYTESEQYPLATSFESLKRIKKYERGPFYPNQIRRYTLVTWLEGEDEDSLTGEGEPFGATLKLGVEITAYENE